MVVKMASSTPVSGKLSSTSMKSSFNINALLDLENKSKVTGLVNDEDEPGTAVTNATSTISSLSNKTAIMPMPYGGFPLNAGFLNLSQSTFMDPIYRTDSTSESSTAAQQRALLQNYPWTALAALHSSTVQAAAAAFTRSYLPMTALIPQGHHVETSSTDWGEFNDLVTFF